MTTEHRQPRLKIICEYFWILLKIEAMSPDASGLFWAEAIPMTKATKAEIRPTDCARILAEIIKFGSLLGRGDRVARFPQVLKTFIPDSGFANRSISWRSDLDPIS